MKKFYRTLSVVLSVMLLLSAVPAMAEDVTQVTMVLPCAAAEEELYTEYAEKFAAENPDIDLNFIATPNEAAAYGNAVQLMFASDEAPDIIRVSGSFPTAMKVSYSKGLLADLTPYLTDDYKAIFPEGTFGLSGGLMLDEGIYGIPFIANRFPAFRSFFYNMDILNEYGYDKPAESWAELQEMLTTISEKSGGSIYGMTTESKSNKAKMMISSLADTVVTDAVDVHVTEGNFMFNTKTGEAFTANPGTIAATNFIKGLNDANLMAPGWETVDQSGVIMQFATGQIAVLSGASHYCKLIKDINPDINYEITAAPAQDPDNAGHRYVYSIVDPYYSMTSACQNKEAAWRVLEYFSSLEFQTALYETQGRVTVSYNAYPEGTLEDYMAENMARADEFLRVAPDPGNKHEDANTLISNILANCPKPTLNEMYLLSIINDEDIEPMLQKYDEELNVIIDEQIALLQESGSDITRDALIFPEDWDKTVDYIN